MASLMCLTSVGWAGGHLFLALQGEPGLLHKLVHESQCRQVWIQAMPTSHLLVSHWAKQRDDLALSQHGRGLHKGVDSGRFNSPG